MGNLYSKIGDLRDQYEWLEDVLTPLDVIISNALEPWKNGPNRGYIEYKYLELLSDVGSLLEKCLSYRREYTDLQAAAAKQVLDYQLFQRQFDTLSNLELQQWQVALLQTEAEHQANAAEKFQLAGELGAGFAELSLGGVALKTTALRGNETRESLVNDRWASLKEHQERLQQRHSEPGHPLNFADRARRVRDMMLEDIKEAANKAVYVRRGLKKYLELEAGDELYDRNIYLNSERPLDDFVKWTRDTIQVVERTLQWDCEYNSSFLFGWADSYTEITSEAIRAPGGYQAARLQSIGMSLQMDKQERIEDPQHVVANFSIKLGRRPPFVLSSIGILVANRPIQFFSGRQVMNWMAGERVTIRFIQIVHSTKPGSVSKNDIAGVNVHANWLCRPNNMDVEI